MRVNQNAYYTWIPEASGGASREAILCARPDPAPLPAHDSRIIRPSNPCPCAFNHAPLLLCRFATER